MPDSPLSTRVYCQEWLESIDVSSGTYNAYRSAIKHISKFFGDKDIRTIRYKHIVAFKKWIPLTSKGVYNTVNTLKSILRDAYRNEDIQRLPLFPKLSYNRPEIVYLSLEQQEKLLSEIPEYHRPIFQFMMEYGVRPQEARALQKDCIQNGIITIRRVFSKNLLRETTKTGDKGKRGFEITSYIAEVLKQIQPHFSPFVFVREDGQPYTSKDLNRIWHHAEKKTGIKCKLYNAVRHSLGCQLLDQGEDIHLVKTILGHTNISMTERYAKRKIAGLTDALTKRRKIINFKNKDRQ